MRSAVRPSPRTFTRLVHAEWTKLRTVPGWVAGLLIAMFLVMFFAVLTGATGSAPRGPRQPVPVGPGGEPVTDTFYFAHRTMPGTGGITVAVTSLRDLIPTGPQSLRGGTVPWAKAGIIITADGKPGSPYAAIMVTSSHGARFQYDYTHDRPGLAGHAPRWLRLTRSGDTITGYDSADGTHWSAVGTVHLASLPPHPQTGLFVACPPYPQGAGTVDAVATAAFSHPSLRGQWPRARWRGTQVGGNSASFGGYPMAEESGGFTATASGFTLTGAGDLAPAVRGTLPTGGTIADLLAGTFAAVIAVAVVATTFITTEYRQGLIRVTLAASPRRGHVLAAKATVLAPVTFACGLAAAAIAIPLGEHFARAKGIYLFPVTPLTELRVEAGTAALLAGAAILALAIGALLRRSGPAVTAVTVPIILPYILVMLPFLPPTAAQWLTRITPAAAFATLQTLTPYPQVNALYTPANGYYPLAPWAGLAVLYTYAGLALWLAITLLHRRDA